MSKHQLKKPILIAAIIALIATVVCVTLAVGGLVGSGEEIPTVTYYAKESGYLSPSGVAVLGDYAYVSDATGSGIYKVDLASGAVVGSTVCSQKVNGIYSDGQDLYALSGALAGDLLKLNANLETLGRYDAGHTPVAAASDASRIYVVNRFSGDLYVYTRSTMALESVVPVGREPMALTLAGGKLYIACHLTETASNASVVAAKIAVYDPADGSVGEILLTNGSTGVKDLCVSSDGNYLYVTSVISRYAAPTTQLTEGWVNTNGLNVIDLRNDSLVCAVLLDDQDRGAANPWTVEAANGTVAVTLSGLDQVMLVDENAMLSRIAAATDKAAIANSLTFLSGAKTRIDLKGRGPRAAILNGSELLVCDYFSAAIERLPLDGGATTLVTLGASAEPDPARVGEIIWTDASLCYQGWESCASCHPEGRCDGQSWDEAGDGYGTAKNTKSMIYAHRTPPSLATGLAGPAENNVHDSIRGVYGNAAVTDEQIACVDVYLRSLVPEESPYLTRDGELSASAKRGKALFTSSGCASCHGGSCFTDMQDHLSPTLEFADDGENRPFNTPTLTELWRSAPYFFNGGMTTMDAVVNYYNDTYSLGLGESEVADLAEYLLSIGSPAVAGDFYAVEEVFFEKNGELSIVKPVEGGSLAEITVRKQLVTAKDAYVRFTLYNADGSVALQAAEVTLNGGMQPTDTAKIAYHLTLPELEDGMYYTVELLNNRGAKLGTTYTYTYHE